MKTYVIHECEICGFTSRSKITADEHEAKHFGLTLDEMYEYNIKKKNVQMTSSKVASSNNPINRRKFNEAILELCSFEKEHNISKELRGSK